MALPYKKGSNGPEIRAWQDWAYSYAKSYADLIGTKDAYYGLGEVAFTAEMQRRLGLPQTGIFDTATAVRVGFRPGGVTPTVPVSVNPKAWLYSAPGSGAPWNIGPSFEVGEWCKNNLGINHQPLGFAIGGYLGLMGGDPSFSYNDVIYDQYKSLEFCLDHNPDIADPNLELWFTGYSQSADGMEDALEILFGDGGFVIPKTGEVAGPGKYRHLRERIRYVVNFGNPSRQKGTDGGAPGYFPVGWGIARKVRPQWMSTKVVSVTNNGDFYACVDDSIRPVFYGEIVTADTELPFFVHIMIVAMEVIANFVPIIGGILGPFAPAIVAGIAGIGQLAPLLGGLMGQASTSHEAVDQQLIQLFTVQGLIKSLPDLIKLIAGLQGLMIHGEYHLPKPEFNGRSGIQVGCDIVRNVYHR